MKPLEKLDQCLNRKDVRHPKLIYAYSGAGVLSAEIDCVIRVENSTFLNNIGLSAGVLELKFNVQAFLKNCSFFKNSGVDVGILRATFNVSVHMVYSGFILAENETFAEIALLGNSSSLDISHGTLAPKTQRTASIVKVVKQSSFRLSSLIIQEYSSTIGKNPLFQCEDVSKITFINTTFLINESPLISGVWNCTINIFNSKFRNNTGCLVDVATGSKLNVYTSDFIANKGILLTIKSESKMQFNDSQISFNTAYMDIQLIVVEHFSEVSFTNGSILRNEGDGLLMVSFFSNISFYSIQIGDNNFRSFILDVFDHSFAMISNTTLLVNYNALTSDKINSCRMISVRKNSHIAMSESFIAHNKLKSQYSKSIVVKDKSTFEALRCQFIANNGHDGGVACCEGNSTINWTDSTFQQNHAADYGGVLHSEDCAVTLVNCLMESNSVVHLKGSCIASFRDTMQVTLFAKIAMFCNVYYYQYHK